MTARFTTDPPLASTDTWVGRQAPSLAYDRDCPDCGAPESATSVHGFACEHDRCPTLASTDTWVGRRIEGTGCMRWPAHRENLDEIFRGNMARRDQAAADYGEPETPHEFYRGRPGSQAEGIVLNCLRALQAIPEIDRLGADVLMDVIARDYLATALDAKTSMRRTTALLRIAGEKA